MLLRRRKLAALLVLVWAAALFRFELALLLLFVALFNAASLRGRWRSAMGSVTWHLLLTISKSFYESTISPSPILINTRPLPTQKVVSTALDSIRWRRLVWPEWEVFYFNVIQNKSSEWGTSPWHWYLTSALPNISVPLLPLSILGFLTDRKLFFSLAAPVLAFITTLSFLPHKELRFIFPAMPALNASAAVFLAGRMGRSERVASLATAAVVAIQIATTVLKLYVSRFNYAGGAALMAVHDIIPKDSPAVSLHIDEEVAMTGASRFLHLCPAWR